MMYITTHISFEGKKSVPMEWSLMDVGSGLTSPYLNTYSNTRNLHGEIHKVSLFFKSSQILTVHFRAQGGFGL